MARSVYAAGSSRRPLGNADGTVQQVNVDLPARGCAASASSAATNSMGRARASSTAGFA
ncbi:MAG: hypothetical protein M3464_03540 [Chloroflexota bacterium]|nr:hypothetical protein [Chloroflexota bacterium]